MSGRRKANPNKLSAVEMRIETDEEDGAEKSVQENEFGQDENAADEGRLQVDNVGIRDLAKELISIAWLLTLCLLIILVVQVKRQHTNLLLCLF